MRCPVPYGVRCDSGICTARRDGRARFTSSGINRLACLRTGAGIPNTRMIGCRRSTIYRSVFDVTAGKETVWQKMLNTIISLILHASIYMCVCAFMCVVSQLKFRAGGNVASFDCVTK